MHPCLSCGACCAALRVSFYWAEPVPEAVTEPIGPFRAAMRGTNQKPPRCVALEGTVGEAVRCTIYADRPSPCREFAASWEDGERNERCDEVRARHGLPPLTAESWTAGAEARPTPRAAK